MRKFELGFFQFLSQNLRLAKVSSQNGNLGLLAALTEKEEGQRDDHVSLTEVHFRTVGSLKFFKFYYITHNKLLKYTNVQLSSKMCYEIIKFFIPWNHLIAKKLKSSNKNSLFTISLKSSNGM